MTLNQTSIKCKRQEIILIVAETNYNSGALQRDGFVNKPDERVFINVKPEDGSKITNFRLQSSVTLKLVIHITFFTL